MTNELEKNYDSRKVEEKIYNLWLDSGFFNPDNLPDIGGRESGVGNFSMVLPPPNVTGTLHVGHALGITIEDILIRYQRMRGRKTLWIPGTDHAAIATQSKVEEILYKTESKTRHDLGREKFLKRVTDFAQKSHDNIVRQIRRLGASVDWSREAFTLDEKRSLSVRTAFKKMYDLGLIYRGARVVNWDPKLQTTVSDDELEWKEEKVPFYYLRYGPFVISTARPETKFGDKYVVVHPDDARYTQYQHGQIITVEWINGPITATIIKDSAVDMTFGTGVMTITPWHDRADFEIAQRHNLEKKQIIDFDGKLLPIAGEFAGLHIKKARPLIVEKLRAKGLLEKVDENYTHRLAVNTRGGGIIEPQIKEQWFVAVNKEFSLPHSKLTGVKDGDLVTLKNLMRVAVENGQIKIIPDHFAKTYFHWIDNLRDWCVSRQIWYGHRVPVWYCLKCQEVKINLTIKSRWFLVRHGETDWNKEERYQGHSGSPLNNLGKEQAREAAEKLKENNIDLIISSDLPRCRETAEIISKTLGVELLFDKRLRERHGGVIEGTTREERVGKFSEEEMKKWRDYETRLPGGESWKELEERMSQALADHLVSHSHKNIVIVTHGGSIQMLLKNIKDAPFKQSREYVPENAEVIPLDISSPCDKCGNFLYEQDPDTLDTWFSSGLWTFSTLGWPDQTRDLTAFHPISVLETGYDILFFWVARMILMSACLLGEIPFRTVYLHGLIRDKDRQKMSKSKDNVIDPLAVIDTYGTDALRMALIFSTSPGNDVPLAEEKVKGMKHFANKLWNVARFILTNISVSETPNVDPGSLAGITDADKTILEKLSQTREAVTKNLDEFQLHEAAQAIYQFIWRELADIYLEASKKQLTDPNQKELTQKILAHCLISALKLLHPFMPFVTEEIWQKLPLENKKLLLIESW